ncbi:MAG: hypothetical protein ABJA81_04295 [Nocardioidaceae bacterium]
MVDLPVFGRPARLVWRKQRWRCPNVSCAVETWSEHDPTIASQRSALATRAARWATRQVGKHGRAVSEVADDLACDWHTVMDAVVVFGQVLIDDPCRVGPVTAVGLDETLYKRQGRYRRQCWSTQIVDVEHGQLLAVVAGREGARRVTKVVVLGLRVLDSKHHGAVQSSRPQRRMTDIGASCRVIRSV